ncbi:MAG: hypothetical protein R3C19_04470 [Planctomycetaceae bacterium]
MEKLIVFLIIIGISAIRGMMKNAEDKAAKARRMAAGGNLAPERKQRVQSEIEAFLSEVGAAPAKPAQPRQPLAARPTAASPSAQVSRPPRPERQQPAPPKQRKPRPSPAVRQPERPKPRVAQQSVTKRAPLAARQQVGTGIGSHVDQYISQHVSQHLDHDVDESVTADIVNSVNSHLGSRDREMPALTGNRQAASPAGDIVRLLRNPEGIRQAILINEVLTRPRALRRS